jgi:hypothetical protein
MILRDEDLIELMSKATKLGYAMALIDYGILKPYLSQNEAFNKYGRKTVEGWVKHDLIIPQKDGNHTSKIRYDRIQLETVAAVSNRNW